MSTQDTHDETASPKKARKRTGLTLMGIAAVCFVILYIMYAAGIGGIIYAMISLAVLIFLVVGLIYLIAGFVGKK